MRSRRPPTEAASRPQMRWRGPGSDRARARPFTGGQRPGVGFCCRQNHGPGAPWRKPKPARREACIPSAALRLVGDELAMHVTAEASLGSLARSKGCSVLGKVGVVGAVALRRRGVAAATSRPLGL